MTEQRNIPRNIDSLVIALPETVRLTLADLKDAPRATAETTIALLPFGRRALLEAVNVTQTEEGEPPPRERVTLTDWGRQVIDACAAYEQPVLDETEQEQRTSDLRARLSAVPPAVQ